MKPKKKKAAKDKAPAEQTHFRKGALAQELGVSRVTLDAYLNRDGAPQKNAEQEFELEAVANFIAKLRNADSGVKGPAHWRAEKFRLECERIALDMQIRRGEFVTKTEIRAGIVPLISELDAMMEQQFVQVLPARYKGHTPVECAEMNRAAKDLVTSRFRSGAKELGAA